MLWFVIILNKGHWRVTEMWSRSTILVTGELNLDDCVDRFGIELTGVTWRTESCIPLRSECIFTVDGDRDEQDKWFNLSVASNQYQLFVLIYFYFELLKRHLTQNSSWPGYWVLLTGVMPDNTTQNFRKFEACLSLFTCSIYFWRHWSVLIWFSLLGGRNSI